MGNSATIKFKVENGDQLAAMLKDFEQKVAQTIAKQALEAAAKPIVTAAKAKCPRRYGALRDSIGIKTAKYPNGVTYTAIGPRRGWAKKQKKYAGLTGNKGNAIEPDNYAHLVEFGTKPHYITRTVVRKLKGGGEKKYTIKYKHPGARKDPFMRPAWDANKQNVFGIMKNVIASAVDKELRNALR